MVENENNNLAGSKSPYTLV